MTRILLLACAAIVLTAPGVRAQGIYTWVDEHGVKHMESRRPSDVKDWPQRGFDENTKEEFREKARESAGAQFSEEREVAAQESVARQGFLDKGLAFFGFVSGDKAADAPKAATADGAGTAMADPESGLEQPPAADAAPVAAIASGPDAGAQYPTVRAQVVVGAPKVDLYVTSWCPWCRKAEEYLKQKGVPYTVYDIEKDPEAKARKSKLDDRRGVPFAVIGEQGVHGYDPDAYDKALKAAP